MLHFSKISKLEAIFDALKRNVNNFSKQIRLSLVLHETLKTLAQRDVRNSKITPGKFRILS